MLAFFSVVAGIGNGVFHPVDYTLLNRKIHPSRLGHAFSVHGITGSLGWALAPAMLVPITLAFSWRVALASRRRARAGRCWRVLVAQPGAADDRDDERRHARGRRAACRPAKAASTSCDPGGLDVLRASSSSTPIVAQRRAGLRARGGAPAARRAARAGRRCA